MARMRTLKPEFAKSEAIACLPRDVRLHFALLWTYADDAGRGADNPKLIKAELWPLDDEVTAAVVEEWQACLAAHGRIVRYEVDGRRFFEIVNFEEHQKPQHPKASIIPEPNGNTLSVKVEAPESIHEAAPVCSEILPVVVGVEVVGEVVVADAPAEPEPKPPRRGTQLPDDFWPTDHPQLRAWASEHCPLVDITTETDQWRDWHKAKGDTAKDWTASWRNWLRKAQTYAQERHRPTRHQPTRVGSSLAAIERALVQ